MLTIEVQVHIAAPLDKVWDYFLDPAQIIHWNFASADWKCPSARNDPSPGGTFSYRMEAVDGSMGFDFEGTFLELQKPKRIVYKLADDRQVEVLFSETDGQTLVTESFEAEDIHSSELQKTGWQAILNQFKHHTETH